MHDEPIAFSWMSGGGRMTTEKNNCGTLVKNQTQAVAHSLKADGFDASEDGTGRGTPLVPVGVDGGETGFALRAGASHSGDKGDGGVNTTLAIKPGLAVRRLTPRECERLQGFPDDWTLIPWRKATAENCPDGPRYKALGNSMAVPVMRWIGQRIDRANAIT